AAAPLGNDVKLPPIGGASAVFQATSDGLGLIIAARAEDGRVAHATTGLETWIISSPADLPALADRVSRHIEITTIIASASNEGIEAARELSRRLEARGIEARIVAGGADATGL
ncbi:MAG: hypothetical protein WAN43_00535, partial [Rhodomicrobium sp.]